MKAFLFPGQGSQKKGMGAELFPRYPEYVKKADEILGYSIEELCVADPHNRLNSTAYTQPAIFVVSVLNYLDTLKLENRPGFVAGHSIGEYAALFAAEAFNFETGLQIVKKRAELMSQAEGGALAAVVGLSLDEVEERIRGCGLDGIEIANINSPTQVVVGATAAAIQQFVKFNEGRTGRVIPLKVSGAFHTSHMQQAQEEFRKFLDGITFKMPSIEVVANFTAQPHRQEEMGNTLASHLANRVRWIECVEYLLDAGVEQFTEIGSKILMPMVNDIRERWAAVKSQEVTGLATSVFCETFGLDKPMVVGGMGYGAAGLEHVSSLASKGILAFLDTDGLPLSKIESALQQLGSNEALTGRYGVSITLNPDSVGSDEAVVALCLKYAVRFIEARGYFEPTLALLRYRIEGGVDDKKRPNNRILLHVSEADSALPFLEFIDDLGAPMVDLISLDTYSWRSVSRQSSDQLSKIMHYCSQVKSPPFGRIFVGLSGVPTAEQPVRAALEKGGDFALLSTVFLLAEEALLDQSIKVTLTNAHEEEFREIFDWAYPAFRTTTYSHVMNSSVSEQIELLQQLYLQEELEISSLRELAGRYQHEEANVLSDEFIDGCEGMNKLELREALRKRVRSTSFPYVLHCDSPFPHFSRWLRDQGVSFPVGAVKLANLIYSTPLAESRG